MKNKIRQAFAADEHNSKYLIKKKPNDCLHSESSKHPVLASFVVGRKHVGLISNKIALLPLFTATFIDLLQYCPVLICFEPFNKS